VLDHFFILTEPGAPQGELLLELGLVEGSRNDHPGQGTANRRFFFRNAMLELLYVRDAVEASSGRAKKFRFIERVDDSRYCPFGLILRAPDESTEPPFPGWRDYPDYFGPDIYFHVGANSDILEEPLCVVMPSSIPPQTSQPRSPEPYTTVTDLRIDMPVIRPSQVLRAMEEIDGISVRLGLPHCMEVVFNRRSQKSSRDFRPDLPLIIHW